MVYLEKEIAESKRRSKEHLEWLKAQGPIRGRYAGETARRNKEHIDKHRDFEKTLGKYGQS